MNNMSGLPSPFTSFTIGPPKGGVDGASGHTIRRVSDIGTTGAAKSTRAIVYVDTDGIRILVRSEDFRFAVTV